MAEDEDIKAQALMPWLARKTSVIYESMSKLLRHGNTHLADLEVHENSIRVLPHMRPKTITLPNASLVLFHIPDLQAENSRSRN